MSDEPRWEVTTATPYQLSELLEAGWEPFAAETSTGRWGFTKTHLRRLRGAGDEGTQP